MRVEKSCKPKMSEGHDIQLGEIPVGTVFRYYMHACGPYIRTTSGIFETDTNIHYTHINTSLRLTNYERLSNARLVTGEDE